MPTTSTSNPTHFPYPIALILFNRPDYAGQVLESLASQTLSVDPKRVVVVRDGYQGSRYEHEGVPDRTAEVDRLVGEYFPEALLFAQERNLGIARAFDLAENTVFAWRKAKWAAFFEEDFVLDEPYLAQLDRMIAHATPSPEVAVLSATGDYPSPMRRGASSLYPLQHLWAFALRRTHWLERKHVVERYLDALGEAPYWQRDHLGIQTVMAEAGLLVAGSSQDYIKRSVLIEHGRLALTTGAAFGSYIGREGEHFTPELFHQMGYDKKRKVQAQMMSLPELTPRLGKQLRDETRALHDSYFVAQGAPRFAALKAHIENLQVAHDGAIESVIQMRSSWTWKIGAPFRLIRRALTHQKNGGSKT